MALIKCGECGREISDKAQTCIGCGAPIGAASEVAAIGKPVVTTEATSKHHKAQMLWASLCIIVGIVILVASDAGLDSWAAVVLFVGLIWLIVAKISAWWHHG